MPCWPAMAAPQNLTSTKRSWPWAWPMARPTSSGSMTVALKPGVRELLARLKAEGARMCICSNTWSAQCRTVLTRLGIDEYFDFYVEAQGALHKSRPDVFFQTLARLGGTDPDRCVVCEDSLYAARTAHDAGFRVIGIADAASKSDEPALREVSDQFLTDWTELDWDKV